MRSGGLEGVKFFPFSGLNLSYYPQGIKNSFQKLREKNMYLKKIGLNGYFFIVIGDIRDRTGEKYDGATKTTR